MKVKEDHLLKVRSISSRMLDQVTVLNYDWGMESKWRKVFEDFQNGPWAHMIAGNTVIWGWLTRPNRTDRFFLVEHDGQIYLWGCMQSDLDNPANPLHGRNIPQIFVA